MVYIPARLRECFEKVMVNIFCSSHNKEKIDIPLLSARRKKETVDRDRRTPGVEGRRRPASSRDDASQKPDTPLLCAGMRGDVGFRACSPDTDGTSTMGWGRRWQRNNVARKR